MLLNLEIPQTIAENVAWAREELRELGSDEALSSTEILLAEVLECSRVSLQIDSKKFLSKDQEERFRHFISLRKKRRPVAYIIGRAFWMQEELKVTPDCLIPRQETETLIESFAEVTKFKKEDEFTFLDLGTGSGAIAVSLLRLFSKAKATLADISSDALKVAEFNIKNYGLSERAKLICSDGFLGLKGMWDVIVSNPPYIATSDIDQLEPEVLLEPRQALDGGTDGLDFYRLLAVQGKTFLKENGFLIVEIGQGQAEAVKVIFKEAGFKNISEKKDLLNISRIVNAQKVNA